MADLKSYVERIERLDQEQRTVGTDKKSVFDEAAEAGFDRKALRKLLAERRKGEKERQTDRLVDEYRMLLAAPGATLRAVAAQTGVSKSKLQRLVPKNKNGTAPAHDVPAASLSSESNEGDSERRPDPVGCDGAGKIKESCGGVESRHALTERSDGPGPETVQPLASPSSEDRDPKPVAPGPQDPDLTIPIFLRRTKAQHDAALDSAEIEYLRERARG